jgi:ketosteroid isomerase-like protein
MLVSKSRCALCGGEVVRRPDTRAAEVHATHAQGVLDDLAAAVWVQAYDAAWLGQHWRALEQCLAPDVAVMLGSTNVITGRAAVLAHIREMMTGTVVHEYNATDLKGHASGATGVITYRWQLDWTVGSERRATSGRDILVLRAAHESWQLVWRAQVRRRSIRDHRGPRVARRRSATLSVTGTRPPI